MRLAGASFSLRWSRLAGPSGNSVVCQCHPDAAHPHAGYSLARRCPVPVELDVRAQARLPERVEVAAYYVVSEALTNAAKHAHASVVNVEVETVEG